MHRVLTCGSDDVVASGQVISRDGEPDCEGHGVGAVVEGHGVLTVQRRHPVLTEVEFLCVTNGGRESGNEEIHVATTGVFVGGCGKPNALGLH